MEDENRTARLEHIIFRNEANAYVVGMFQDEKTRHSFTGAGRMEDPEEDQVYELTGQEVQHPRFGRQFQILVSRRQLPDEADAVVRFLSGPSFPGIGCKSARQIVDSLGEGCLEAIAQDPALLSSVPGLNERKIEVIREGLTEYAGDGTMYVKLLEWGLAPRQVSLLQSHYKDISGVLEDDPFRPLYEVYGFGYQSALKLAEALKVPGDDLRRLDALLYSSARDLSMKTGSTWVSMAQLWDTVRGLETDLFEASLERLDRIGALELENQRIYPFGLKTEEQDIARGIADHTFEVEKPEEETLSQRIRETEFAFGIQYDQRQKEAIRQFFSRSCMMLNGGPGTGKTTVVRAILSICRSLYPDVKVQLAAPTGRAAKRLATLSDDDARTIHSLLRWNKDDNTFAKGPSDPLDCDFLIIDESSMIDTHLFASLLLALPADARLLLIGDEDQLESVGPGKVFQDLIASERIPVVHLDRIWRQSQGSGIITLAREIRDEVSCSYADGVVFEELSPEQITPAILKDIEDGYDPDRCQVLAPMYKGPAGIEAVNEALQQLFNPAKAGKAELVCGPVTFREGDKVMLLKNMPDEEVYNGDMGFVAEIDAKAGVITVDFGTTLVDFAKDYLYYLSHAWCVSVHKAQGSEYDKVYCITESRNPGMLNKKLLYTAISRAKKQLIILGSKATFENRVRVKARQQRQTTLAQRMQQYLRQPVSREELEAETAEQSGANHQEAEDQASGTA